MSVTLRRTVDQLTPWLRKATATVQRPRAIMAAAARGGRNFLVRHFRALDASNVNTMGGPRQHFWQQVGESVHTPEITDTSATIAIADSRLPHKVFGGDIVGKRWGYIQFAVRAEAYGLSRPVFEQATGVQLRFFGRGNSGIWATANANGEPDVVYYVRKPQVHQNPFPGALPPLDDLAAAALEPAQKAYARQLAA